MIKAKILPLFASVLMLCCCNVPDDAKSQELRFNDDGSFKIVQLTDLHLVANRPEERVKTLERLERLAKLENPDLIVITGDMTFGGLRPDTCLTELMQVLTRLDTPFLALYGNHDAEQQMPRPEMSRLICSNSLSINSLNAKGELADVDIPILSHDCDTVAYSVIGLDSHDYSKLPQSGTYGWFSFEQVQWLREQASGSTAALAFFHIPLYEFRQLGQSGDYLGNRMENEASADYNPGMFLAMKESGNVQGIFCGHDHNDDYIGVYGGIALAYGRYSGDNTVYHDIPQSGLRTIVLSEGSRGFETWIRQDDGSVEFKVRFENGQLYN